MRRFWLAKIIGVVAFTALAIGVFGYVVMSLWNWLIPGLTGWHALTLLQALGLLVLCRILFGGVHGRGWHGSRRHWGGRWGNMSDEEREKFRAAVRNKWAFGPPPGESHQA